MEAELPKYKRILFLGIIFTALGITLTNVFHEESSSIGIVFIAIGGLFIIIGAKQKGDCCD